MSRTSVVRSAPFAALTLAAALVASGCDTMAPPDQAAAIDPGSVGASEISTAAQVDIAAAIDPMTVDDATVTADQATAVPQPTAGLAGLGCDVDCPIAQWIAEERYAEAREALTARMQADPEDLEALVQLARVELLDEEYEAAYDAVQARIAVAPALRLMEMRAAASLMAGDVATALTDFNELMDAIDQADGDPLEGMPRLLREANAQAGLATVQYNRGALDEAEALAGDLVEIAAEDRRLDPSAARFVLALAASKRGDDATALAHYQWILSRHPNHPGTLNNIGGVHYRAGELEAARADLEAAYEHAAGNRHSAALAWSNVAEIDILEGKYADAEDKLLEAVAISKRACGPRFNLAVLYDLQGEIQKARAWLGDALRLDPQGVARWNMSWYTPEWKTQFDALLAEQEGRLHDARELWLGIVDSEVTVLAETAKRHLGQ